MMKPRIMGRLLVVSMFFACGLAGLIAPPAAAGSIEDLQPGHWYEVPNSRVRQILPNPFLPGNPSYIMRAWSGGAYDTKRDRFIIWGGGHGDYGGNEVYAFDVNTLSWFRWGPSREIPPVGGPCTETYRRSRLLGERRRPFLRVRPR